MLAKTTLGSYPFKVWEWVECQKLPRPLIIRFTWYNWKRLQLSWGKFQREPATRLVRLVFRPYTQIWQSICTSELLQAITRVSPSFTLFRHSSPSFGSQHLYSHSAHLLERKWPVDCERIQSNHLHYAPGINPYTRTGTRLLSPCFKTGKKLALCILTADEQVHITSIYTGSSCEMDTMQKHCSMTTCNVS